MAPRNSTTWKCVAAAKAPSQLSGVQFVNLGGYPQTLRTSASVPPIFSKWIAWRRGTPFKCVIRGLMDFRVVPGAKTRVSAHHSLFHTTQPVAHHISTYYLSLLWGNQRGISWGHFTLGMVEILATEKEIIPLYFSKLWGISWHA